LKNHQEDILLMMLFAHLEKRGKGAGAPSSCIYYPVSLSKMKYPLVVCDIIWSLVDIRAMQEACREA
jgi:hypothetical protein